MRKKTDPHVLFIVRKKYYSYMVKSYWHLHNRSVMLHLFAYYHHVNDIIDLALLTKIV